jgi:multicomponent Na+:H+ antiporter subunit B
LNGHTRGVLASLGIAGVLFTLIWGALDLPAVGHYLGPYGDVVSPLAVFARHATDAVSAVNFDFRGLDTLGEEFILFTSVLGVTLLLRQSEEGAKEGEESDDHAQGRPVPPTGDAVRSFGAGTVGLVVLFGVYMVTHGAMTPGGGFQGGVVLATVPLLVYLSSSPRIFERIAPRKAVEAGESVGAFGYVLIGLFGVVAGEQFLRNVVPLGKAATLTGGGTIVLLNLTVGLEIATGFVLLMIAFLDEALERRKRASR